ncbi:NAD-dependent epimerase/dehydratase family protein [Bordetella sp. 2513F-2]
MSERVLLAGCGDLGLRVAQRLLARGAQVWGLRRGPPQAGGPPGMHWLQADLAGRGPLTGLPPDITQLVYLPAPDARSQDAYQAIFLHGLQRTLSAAGTATLRRVLFVSSSAVYGEHHGAWVDERTELDPPGFNGAVLRQAEQRLHEACRVQGVPAVVLRLAGLYGPGRLQLVERLRAGRARAPRHPPHWANRMHIDDAADAIVHLLALPEPQPLYLGCDDTPLPLHELYAHLAALVGAPPPPDGPPPSGVGSKRLSNARLRASGYAPRWPDARAGYAALLASPANPQAAR